MSQIIVILLILFIFTRLTNTNRVLKFSSKKGQIEFLEKALKEARESKLSDSSLVFSIVIILILNVTVIYYAIMAILSLVK